MSKARVISKGTIGVALGALAAVAAAAGVIAVRQGAPAVAGNDASLLQRAAAFLGSGDASGAAAAAQGVAQPKGRYIVLYREQPLATYKGGVQGIAAPARMNSRTGAATGRLAVKSAEAVAYVRYLKGRQQLHESNINQTLGRSVQVGMRMQHAVNGAVMELTAKEADRLRQMGEVALVEAYREYVQDTDIGPTLIGAPALWNATPTPFKGEGVVLGIIDSGINYASPSFSATDIEGYTHSNPLGAGNYLGTCAAGGVDAGRCNDKLIGGYDFVCDVATGPSTTVCTTPAVYREEPGFGDTNGHGSHTASTAGGNFRNAAYRGNNLRLSGVAPRANIIAYDACYTEATGQMRGLCPNVSTLASVNQAIADGIVDVINYSIGGGTQPWSEAVSLAFLNATDAGIYVATSAGNSGPTANTLGHVEPWTSATAASQHGRGDYAFLMQVTGPQPVPAALTTIEVNAGTGGVAHSAAIPATTPLFVSPRIDTTDDGCTALPAGSLQGGIAVFRRGTCSFTIKTNNAAAAGAIAVVIANNAAVGLIPSVPDTTIPAFGIKQADGNALRDFAAANSGETAMIGFPAAPLPNVADALGDFSSRGPAGTFDIVKPDITAPGVRILATIAGDAGAVDLYNGTSMASPHNAGAAALLRQAKPTWTVAEIKSALMMTAKQQVFKEDTVTQATPHDMGAGRVQVDQAIKAGLVLNETKANYLAANPATGGDVSALNIPSMGKYSCANSCTFTRTFRNTQTTRQSWTAKLEGVRGTVSPALVSLNRGETKSIKVTVITSGAATGSWSYGKLVLAPQGGVTAQPTLRLPIAVRVPVPTTNLLRLTNLSGATGSNTFYSITVPAGRPRLIVNTSGGTGDLDLYVGRTQTAPFTCTSGSSTNFETCTIANPAAGTWVIRLEGYAAYAGVTLTADVEVAPTP